MTLPLLILGSSRLAPVSWRADRFFHTRSHLLSKYNAFHHSVIEARCRQRKRPRLRSLPIITRRRPHSIHPVATRSLWRSGLCWAIWSTGAAAQSRASDPNGEFPRSTASILPERYYLDDVYIAVSSSHRNGWRVRDRLLDRGKYAITAYNCAHFHLAGRSHQSAQPWLIAGVGDGFPSPIFHLAAGCGRCRGSHNLLALGPAAAGLIGRRPGLGRRGGPWPFRESAFMFHVFGIARSRF